MNPIILPPVIYIVIHRQICFIQSEVITVARHIIFVVAGIETRLTQTPIQASNPSATRS